MYGSFYLICWSSDDLNKQLVFKKVLANTLREVEDWAMDNLPDDSYYLRTIEKNYCYNQAEMDMMGEVDVTL